MMLVRTPSPHATESLFGYLLRASETNGYETPGDILRLTGATNYRITLNTIPIEELSSILNQKVEVLQRLTYRTAQDRSSSLKILDHDLGKHTKSPPLRTKHSAFCVSCAKEDGYIDAFWDLGTALACPKHECSVLSHCPECHAKLTWFRPGILKCACGADLNNVEQNMAEKPLVELMQIVNAKLHNKSFHNISNHAGFPLEHFECMPFSSFLLILNRLGEFNLQSRKAPTAMDKYEATTAAVEVLSNWPQGYHEFLTRIGNLYMADNPSAVGLRKQFNSFYSAMFQRSFSKDILFLREEFINFGLNVWGKAVVDKKLLRSSESETEQRFISKSEFARRFGIWKPVMERLIADGTVVTKQVRAGSQNRIVVDLKLSQPPAKSTGLITDREAAAFLGLPVSVINHLRESGIYKTKPRAGFACSWHQDDVEEFLRLGLSLANKVDSTPESMEKIGTLMRLTLRDQSAKADIVAAMFDGRLSVSARIGENLSGLLLNKDAVDRFILKKRVEIEGYSFSFPEAADQTGIDPMAIQSAIKAGLLATVERDERTRISEESITHFNAEYITLSRLAPIVESTPRKLESICRKHNIPIVLLTRQNSNIQHYVLSRKHENQLINLFHAEKKKRKDNSFANRATACELALAAYLDGLRKTGGRLPRRKGQQNKVEIANACGFSRTRLYNSPTLIEALNQFDKEEQDRLNMEGFDAFTILSAYLKNLKENDLPLPLSRDNKPNKKVISETCGLYRNVLYTNHKAISLLNDFMHS